VDSFIADAIEAHGLLFCGGGSGGGRWAGIVCRDHRYASVSEADKRLVREWAASCSDIRSVTVSESWDIWHEDDPFEMR
jgi:uncharacterized protein YggL (DUF469 family)